MKLLSITKFFKTMKIERCPWCLSNQDYIHYHDTEWGVPVKDDQLLFECLILESFQAGLSWFTILQRRANFRRAFADFQVEKVAAFTEIEVAHLLQDEGIIRHRGKIEAAIQSAKSFINIQQEFGSFSVFLWNYVSHTPLKNTYHSMAEVPGQTPLSEQLSKDLKKLGFKFLGPTTTYAFMQAVGMVNDHLTHCFRHREV